MDVVDARALRLGSDSDILAARRLLTMFDGRIDSPCCTYPAPYFLGCVFEREPCFTSSPSPHSVITARSRLSPNRSKHLTFGGVHYCAPKDLELHRSDLYSPLVCISFIIARN